MLRKSFRIIICVFIILLLILAALVYIPRTEKLDYNMTGYIIQPDGEIVDQFTFKLTELGKDAFILHFDWGSEMFSHYTFGYYWGDYAPMNNQLVDGSLCYYDGIANASYFETGMLDLENGTYCMYARNLVENAFIVGTSDPNTDPLDVIASYQQNVNIPEMQKTIS